MMRFFMVSHFFLFTVSNVGSRGVLPTSESPPLFDPQLKEQWRAKARLLLGLKDAHHQNTRVAKNVVFIIGDGMSMATITAARMYIGQRLGYRAEIINLSVDHFPYTGLARTYCVDANVADCGCSATACLAGVKVNFGTVGVSSAVKRGDCLKQKMPENSITGLMKWAQDAKKATGIVTTSRVTHATPAAAYAHSADVSWEADIDMPQKNLWGFNCDDIAKQLVRGDVGRSIDVVMGGGRKYFFNNTEKDLEGYDGYRSDGLDLIKEWFSNKMSKGDNPKYLYNRDDLKNLDANKHDSVLGLFSPSHIPYVSEGDEDDPMLFEMAEKAIQVLSKNENGYFLFIEGRIDSAHHETNARKALDETAQLLLAVKEIVNTVNTWDTLVVVTSDHSHVMTFNGYSRRETNILGFANLFNASDSLPYTILSYANGPGYRPEKNNQRVNLALEEEFSKNFNSIDFKYPALFPLSSATHGGEDVPVYAVGPWAHLFTGSYEQNYLPHAIAYAACIGPGFTNCKLN